MSAPSRTRSVRWSWAATGRETLLNLFTAPLHVISLFIAMASATGFLAFADAQAALRAVVEQRDLVESGQFVFVAASPDSSARGTIQSTRCNGSSFPQSEVVGGLSFLGPAQVSSHPGTPFRVYLGTGAIRRVLDPAAETTGGSAISVPLSRAIGIRRNHAMTVDPIVLTGTPVFTSATVRPQLFSPSSRHPFGDSMLLVSGVDRNIDECWVELTASSAHYARGLLRAALLAPNGAGPAVAAAVDSSPGDVSPLDRFAQRSTADASLILGTATGVLAGTSVWFRRQRVALYRAHGMGTFRVGAMVMWDICWPVLSGASCGLAAAALLHRADQELAAPAEVWPVAMRSAFSAVAATLGIAGCATWFAIRGNLVANLKDHH